MLKEVLQRERILCICQIVGLYEDNKNTKGTSEGKLKTLFFLSIIYSKQFTQNSNRNIVSMNSLCSNEMNERDRRNRNEKLERNILLLYGTCITCEGV